jgi:nucleoside-diphosphate-sugar epimerase
MPEPAILLTGATGFIGSSLARQLSQQPCGQLVCPLRGGDAHPKAAMLKGLGAVLVPGDFYDESLVQAIFDRFRVQKIVHLAAIRGGGNASPGQFQQVNVRGTQILLEYAWRHQVPGFIFCSSVGVLGTIPHSVPAKWDAPFNGDNHYHQSKVEAEKLVEKYIDKGLKACVVRPTITYGPGDDGFPHTLINLVRHHWLWLPAVKTRVHLVDVEYLSAIFLRLIQLEQFPAPVFMAADAEPVWLKELADWIHLFFSKTPYPDSLSLPGWLFNLALHFFRGIRNEKWAARVALLSRDWYFSSHETARLLGLTPPHTQEAFSRFLREVFPSESGEGRPGGVGSWQ